MSGGTDYGRDGMVGIGTPQANPTVEAEMAILLPPTVQRVTTRLTSAAVASEDRLRAYLDRLDHALEAFDKLRPDVFGFACTASSYLVTPQREKDVVAAAQARFGYPVVTAAAAIAWKLQALGARRIALVSPYPPALGQAARDYWSAKGFTPVAVGSAPIAGTDTRGIYALGTREARAALAGLGDISVDAILITGTGMPSLPLIADPPPGMPPIISSNLALAEALLACLDLPFPDWRARCRAATEGPFS
jgi:maleate isomerase